MENTEIKIIQENGLDKKPDNNTVYVFKNNLINENKSKNKDNLIKKLKSQKALKEFDKINKESDMIMNNIKPYFFVTSSPTNPYILFLWLLVILIIIFLIVEYINRDKYNEQFDN